MSLSSAEKQLVALSGYTDKEAPWKLMAKVIFEVKTKKLFKEKYPSFSKWMAALPGILRHINPQISVKERQLWGYYRASQKYLSLVGSDNPDDLDTCHATSTKLELLKTISALAPAVAQYYAEKVLEDSVAEKELERVIHEYKQLRTKKQSGDLNKAALLNLLDQDRSWLVNMHSTLFHKELTVHTQNGQRFYYDAVILGLHDNYNQFPTIIGILYLETAKDFTSFAEIEYWQKFCHVLYVLCRQGFVEEAVIRFPKDIGILYGVHGDTSQAEEFKMIEGRRAIRHGNVNSALMLSTILIKDHGWISK